VAIDDYLEISIGGNDSAGRSATWRPAPLMAGRLPATLLDAGIYSP
jgi:hypothetical protein